MTCEQTTPPPPLGRNDKRILDRVCRANGGGVDLMHEPHAPVMRLIKRGLIERKRHPHGGNQPWVHTQMGLLVWRTEK